MCIEMKKMVITYRIKALFEFLILSIIISFIIVYFLVKNPISNVNISMRCLHIISKRLYDVK